MKISFLRLLTSSVCIVLWSCTEGISADHIPIILISKMQTWNASNGLEWCKDGVLSAVVRSVGFNPTSPMFGSSLKDLLPLVQEAPETVAAAARARGSDISKDLAYAETDLLLARESFGDTHVGLAKTIVEMTVLPHLYSSIQNALPVKRKKGFLDMIEKPLLTLTSKTSSQLFRSLIGPGFGAKKPLPAPSSATPEGGVISPMVNLFDAYCLAQEYSLTSNDVNPEVSLCALINAVSSAIACRSDDFDPSRCPKKASDRTPVFLPRSGECIPQKGTKRDPIPIDGSRSVPLHFDSLLPLDDTIPETKIADETVALFFLFRSTSVVSNYVNSYLCGIPSPNEDLLPGWEISHVISYMPDGSPVQARAKVPDIPIGLLGQPKYKNKDNECQKVLSFRATKNQFDWRMDLDTMHVPFLEEEGIKAHRGFVQMTNSIWPSLQIAFNELMDDGYCSGRHELFITGHSLGGGLLITIGMKFAKHYGNNIKINSASFAGPNVLNKAGVDWFRKRVNHRSIAADLDPFAFGPCGTKYPHGFPRCPGIHHSPFGFDRPHTNPGLVVVCCNFQLLRSFCNDVLLCILSILV